MKIKNLLILSVVALLASCGQQAPAGYNTTVNLPDGGTEVAEAQKDQKAGSAIQEFVSGFDMENNFAFGGEINVDISSHNTYNETFGDFQYSSTTDVSVRGKIKFTIMHTASLKSRIKPVYTSRMSLRFEGLSVSVRTSSNAGTNNNVSLNNLTFGLHYGYASADNIGMFLIDLSDPSMKTTIEQYVFQYIDANEQATAETKAAAKAQMIAMLTRYLVTQGGKFYAEQAALIEMIQGIMQSMGGQSSSGIESYGLSPFRAVDDPTSMIMEMLSGDIVENILAMLGNYMPEDPTAGLADMLPTLLQALPYLFKEYKNDAGEVVQYGLGFNINQDNAKEFVTMVASSIMSMMGGGSDTAIVPSELSNEGESSGQEEFALPEGLKFSLGFAMMLGKTHGSTSITLESISAKFSVSLAPTIDDHGAFSIDFYYGEQVADLIGDESAYNIDLISVIQQMMPSGQPQ